MESVRDAPCSLLLTLNPAGAELLQPVCPAPCPVLRILTAPGLGPSVSHSPTSCLGELSQVPACIPAAVASTIYLDQWFLEGWRVILPCRRHVGWDSMVS